MKSRAWATWLIFTVCALAVLEGLGWVTWKALALERAEQTAQAQSKFQERIRLALWRMESEIAPILAQEAARPYFHYQSFYPAERAYTRMLQEVSPGEVMVPSPLLDSSGPYTRVHYQVGPDGAVTSPQAPSGTLRTLAESQYIDPEFLVLAGERMAELTDMVRPAPDPAMREVVIGAAKAESEASPAPTPLPPATPAPEALPVPPTAAPAPVGLGQVQAQAQTRPQYAQSLDAPAQQEISEKEFQARQNLAQAANSYQENRRGKGEFSRSGERQTGSSQPAAPQAAAPQTAAPVTAPAPAAAPAVPAAKIVDKSEAPSPPAPGSATRAPAESPIGLRKEADRDTRATGVAPARSDDLQKYGASRELQAGAVARPGAGGLEQGAGGRLKDEEDLRFAYKAASVSVAEVELGAFQPLWRRNPRAGTPELFVERPVDVGGVHLRQGIWMDWPALKARLLVSTLDLLPGADLTPVPQASLKAPTGQMLASFPVLLVPGASPEPAPVPLVSAPHLTLGVTWLAVLGGVVAIGVVLRTSMELSDRRGRFVSAVTHELRTPLTTFRLYTGILAGGMVKDDDARREYLATLEAESGKLAGIVENVLDYAKLGGRPARNDQPISAAELVAQVLPSLQRSARRCGMDLVSDGEPPLGVKVKADPATVERILLNLVDNACKYAAEATDRRVHMGVGVLERPLRGPSLELSIRDHGPGIPSGERRRMFRAFHRAKRDHAGPHSGLGLGLALSRGLAREMGGDLELVRGGEGTHLRLSIPVAGEPERVP